MKRFIVIIPILLFGFNLMADVKKEGAIVEDECSTKTANKQNKFRIFIEKVCLAKARFYVQGELNQSVLHNIVYFKRSNLSSTLYYVVEEKEEINGSFSFDKVMRYTLTQLNNAVIEGGPYALLRSPDINDFKDKDNSFNFYLFYKYNRLTYAFGRLPDDYLLQSYDFSPLYYPLSTPEFEIPNPFSE